MNEAATTRPGGLISNARWNLFAFSFGLAAQFITLPFVIRWIGLPAFGQGGLVLAMWAPLMLVGTVLGQATTREAAALEGQPVPARRTLAAALWLCFAACAIGLVALVALGPWLLGTLTSGPSSIPGVRLAFAIAGAGWAAQQIVLVLQGAAAARQAFRTMAQVAAFSACATVLLTLSLAAARPTAIGYLSGVAASMLATLLAWLVVCRPRGPHPVALPRWHRAEAVRLLQFGKWQGLAQLTGALGNQIDRYALGMLAPAAIVGQYNAANRLQEAAYVGVMKGGEILFPHFGATASSTIADRQSFFVTASWLTGTLSVVFLAPIVPLAHSLLLLWAGAETADGGAFLLRTLVLGGIVGCGSNVFTYYAMGTGRTRPLAGLSVAYSLLTIVATIGLMRRFGPLAAGGGLLVASLFRVAAAILLTRRLFFPELDRGLLWIATLVPLVAGCAVSLVIDASGAAMVSTWPGVVLAYVAIAAAVFLATLALTLPWPGGRAIVARVLAASRRRRAAP